MSERINTVDAIGDEALTNSLIDRSITKLVDSICLKIRSYAFQACASLTIADFLMVVRIQIYAFANCTALKALVLRSTTVCALENTLAFNGCPLGTTATGSYIYVPADLVESYKAATNWSSFASKFRALEDYTVDGTITGALDETKI